MNQYPTNSPGGMVCQRVIFAIVIAVFLPLDLLGAPPQWWMSRGVLNSNTPNDYGAVNQGQVKNIATQALSELDDSLAQFGGAGDTLHQLQTTLNGTSSSTNDYAPVNLGQLKNVAAPILGRLLAVGYREHPLETGTFPWVGHTANDYSMANIGQVKNLLSFDLTLSSDGSGLPDWWRHLYGIPPGTTGTSAAPRNDGLSYADAYTQGVNPNDYYNGQSPTLAIAGGNGQTANPDNFVPAPLAVMVKDGNNQPFINAPVTFTVTNGGGTLKKSSNAPASTTITVLTDSSGQAKAFFQLPNVSGTTCHITASAGSHSVQVTFSEISDNGTGAFTDPFDASDVVATANPDGSADITWTNNTDPTDTEDISVQYQDLNGNWQTLDHVPAGTTSYHIDAPQ